MHSLKPIPYTFKIPMELLGGLEVHTLRPALDRLANNGTHHFQLDMENVRLMNGPGLRFLADMHLSLIRLGGSLCLINVSPNLAELLESVGLTHSIPLGNNHYTKPHIKVPLTTGTVPMIIGRGFLKTHDFSHGSKNDESYQNLFNGFLKRCQPC